MHIPDGYLSPQTYVPLTGLCLVFWAAALKKVRKSISARSVPYLGVAAAFSFLIMMFNIPILGGTTGHAVGAALIAIVLGPWAAVIIMSVVLVLQALLFGDGGITAIGANCFTMALVMPAVSYWTFRIVRGRSNAPARILAGGFFAGYLGITAAAAATAVLFGIQPLIASGPDGHPLYAPYSLSVALPAMIVPHLALLGIVEGLVTALAGYAFISRERGAAAAMGGGE